MPMIKRIALCALVLVIALAGCGMPSAVRPGTTTADELLQKLGKPTSTRSRPQGGEFWEYAYGPMGTETWLFGIDSGKTVRSAEQLLTEERLQRIVPGVTTAAQVRELLGKPREITRFSEETAWEWRVSLPPNLGIFVVRFTPEGIAKGVNVLIDQSLDADKRGPFRR